MPEEKKEDRGLTIGLAVVGGLIGLAGLIVVYGLLTQAGPPGEYVCPYCGATLDTYEELAAHVQSEHPGERIPLPIEWE